VIFPAVKPPVYSCLRLGKRPVNGPQRQRPIAGMGTAVCIVSILHPLDAKWHNYRRTCGSDQ